jgi:hypothetical protein
MDAASWKALASLSLSQLTFIVFYRQKEAIAVKA